MKLTRPEKVSMVQGFCLNSIFLAPTPKPGKDPNCFLEKVCKCIKRLDLFMARVDYYSTMQSRI